MELTRAVVRLDARDEALAAILERVAQTLAGIERDYAVRTEQGDKDHARYDAALEGSPPTPGLTVRVDRIEQHLVRNARMLSWTFGGGLVAASATVVLLYQVLVVLAEKGP